MAALRSVLLVTWIVNSYAICILKCNNRISTDIVKRDCIFKGNHVNNSLCFIPGNVCADSAVVIEINDALLHGSNLNITECKSTIRVEFQFDAPTMTCERLIMSISQHVVLHKNDKEHHCYGKT